MDPASGIGKFKMARGTMSGNSSWGARNLDECADWVGKMKVMRQCPFLLGIRGSARYSFGKRVCFLETEVNWY